MFPITILIASGSGTSLQGKFASPVSSLRTEIWNVLPSLLAITNQVLAKRAVDKQGCKKASDTIDGHTDLSILRKAYAVLTIVPALFHFYTMGSALASGQRKQAILDLVFPRGSWDYVLTFGPALLWASWNYSRTTLLKGTKSNVNLAAKIATIVPIIGPGAAVAALWGLREESLRAFE